MEGRRVDAFMEQIHRRRGPAAERADNDLRRREVVGDRARLAQELGVVDEFDDFVGTLAERGAENRQDELLGRPRAHRGAVDHSQRPGAVGLQRRGDVAGDLRDEAHVVGAVAPARGADADDGEVGVIECVADLQPRFQPSFGAGR